MKNMPENWEPPVDAWQSAFDEGIEELVFGYFGCQVLAGKSQSVFERQFLDGVKSESAPSFVTRAQYVDSSGYENHLFIAYWNSQNAFDAWWQSTPFAEWWEDDARLKGDTGLWREVFTVPVNRLETLFSSQNPTGAATLGQPFGEPVREHNYWGGMRDRIPASADNDLLESAIGDSLPKVKLPESRGKRLRASIPSNFCLIRSGQNWSDSSDKELETYLDVVRPNLTAGMAFLRDNPMETGCASCRLMDETNLDGSAAAQSFGLALFVSMKHLEDWSKTHPTHLAIFNSFFKMLDAHQGQVDLKLWHEVLIVDGSNSICEYVNCHPGTGLLPYFSTI